MNKNKTKYKEIYLNCVKGKVIPITGHEGPPGM